MGLPPGISRYDCQVTENEMKHHVLLIFATLASHRVVFLAIQEAKPSDKGKPGETRGRKVTGLHLLYSGNDRRTTEMG